MTELAEHRGAALPVPRQGTGAGRGPSRALVGAMLAVIVIQAWLAQRGVAPVMEGLLADPDAYLRLVRVGQLWHGGGWFDSVMPRIDPPDGFALHWTRPLDVLLIVGAGMAAPVIGFEDGLFWAGALLGPILHVIAAGAIVWAAAPLIPRRWLGYVAVFFVAQPAVFARFMIGRPDHHGLLALLFILLLGLTLRMLREPDVKRYGVLAGAVSALALWVSIESLVPVAVTIAALVLPWALDGRRYMPPILVHGASTVLGLAAALVVERGGNAFSIMEYDRLSLAHLLLFALNLALWMALAAADSRRRMPNTLAGRLSWAAAGGLFGLWVLWLAAPGLMADPMASGVGLYEARHLAKISELQQVVSLAEADGPWSERLAKAVLWLGVALLAVPWLAYRIGRSTGEVWRGWWYVALGTLVTLPLAMAQLRWAPYPEILLVLPYAGLCGAVVGAVAQRFSMYVVAVVRPLLVLTMCLWVYVPTLIQAEPEEIAGKAAAMQTCSLKDLAPVLNDPDGLGASRKTILAFIDFGPEILYRTPHAVLAIPNHRPQTGFAESYEIMTATDISDAETRLRERAIDLVLICPDTAEARFYNEGEDGPTLYRRLSAGAIPEFLAPVPLPGLPTGSPALFRVRPFDG